MNTFLPYSDFAKSARVLDRQRLGKQRVEGYQILRTLLGVTSGWRNHPAVKMWRGYEWSLFDYTSAVCLEWTGRGYSDSIYDKLDALPFQTRDPFTQEVPPWLGDPALHSSHRSNLLRKDPEWYGQFGWLEPSDLPYVWPVP